MKKRLKILLVFDSPVPKPRGYSYIDEFQTPDWATEHDVYEALCANGYHVKTLGICKDINILLEELKEDRPDVIFNLAEVFDNMSRLDKNFAALLEMLGIPFTGASSETLMICNDKALHKKILRFHRIRVPRFHTFYREHKVWLPKTIKLPLIVKPLSEEASRGISLASVVDNEAAMVERVKFIHEKMKMDAIVEEFIEGRELYISVLGNKRINILPLREVKFGNVTDEEPRVATYKAKWDNNYRKKWGIKNVFAGKLAEGLDKTIEDSCKRAYHVLNMRCYARFDIRINQVNGRVYILEANANPNLAKDDELSQSAEKAGISYNQLINKIVKLALARNHL
ncbi:MAG: ATP-grasp domain-containing protein [Candidatus Omnitrophica bacterium]|nr:ATP-grasp domain-containing protein [Candidatus Omnitrophota bacterium]MBU1925286.1 ATP-grasp domain-containing protein [Candidatus Omnitrophota bacterium]